jgi:hypothetical protein
MVITKIKKMKLVSKLDIRCFISSQKDYDKAIDILKKHNERIFYNILAYNKDLNFLMINLTTLTWAFYGYNFIGSLEWRYTKKITLEQLDRLLTLQQFEL